jgi:hypothetical protein
MVRSKLLLLIPFRGNLSAIYMGRPYQTAKKTPK